MRCSRCGTENPSRAAYCVECGARLAAVCPRCGIELPPEAKFCLACGAPLSEPRPDPLSESLRRLVPKELADKLLATRGKVGRERRPVTILFSDIKGYTTLSEKLDPEEVLTIVNGAFEFLIGPILRYEGTLAQLMGDAILAFFGAPIAHEDDPERACRAALEILAGAKSYAAKLERERGIQGFGVRVGMHTGLVVVGEVGSDLRVAYTAVGDTINLASRMEAAAEPGTALMTEETHKLVASLFETEALGPSEVKGRAQPVAMYRLLGAKAAPGKGRGIEGLESRLVGREAELRALEEAVERLQAGVGGIATVVGEAGLGKSRLVAELRRGPGGRRVRWAEGRCLSYGGSIAYLPWLDVLRDLLDVTEEQPPAAVGGRLREWLQGLCPERADEAYPYLARLMALPLSPEMEASLHEQSGEQVRAGTFGAVEMVLECVAAQEPLVLVCEDLHWADVTSLALLQGLLGLADRAALLLLVLMRPERDHGSWHVREAVAHDYPHRHTDIWLKPLSGVESETLVGNLLRVEGLPAHLRQRILERAEGNPFYVEEVIRSLIDTGAIAREQASGQWRATRDVAEIAIPDTLQGVLMARIDRLQEDSKRILRMAAVIGRAFLYRVLEAVAQEEQELDRHLLTLQREEMIRERARVPELEFVFKHYLTQEAAYSGLLRQDRRAYHRKVAEALEQLYPERTDEQAGLLAYHWERAEEPGRAVQYLLRAGDQARLLYAHAEAVGFYERALSLVRQQADTEQAALALLKLGQAYHTAFDYRRAHEVYHEAFTLWARSTSASPALPPAPHALRIGFEAPVVTLDPQLAYVLPSISTIHQLFRGLVELTPELDVVPDAAERWEVLDEGRRYVFRLRGDLRWSDGQPLTAYDFEYAWKRLLDPATNTVNAVYLHAIRNARPYNEGETDDAAQVGVRALDGQTLDVELEEPAGEFLAILAGSPAYAVPRHVVEAHGAGWADADKIVTSGPFRLAAWEQGASLVLVRDPAYRGRSRGNVQRAELTYGARWPHLLALYEADALDELAAGLRAEEAARLRQHRAEVSLVPLLSTRYLVFTLSRPPFDDARVRRALAMAIDRTTLPGVAQGLYAPATGGFVPPGMPGHSPGIALPFDPQQARDVLAEAGYPGGKGMPVVELLGFHENHDLTVALEAQWQEHLGVETRRGTLASVEAMAERVQQQPPDLYTATWLADYPDPDNFLRTARGRASVWWQNDTYERLLAQARRCLDQVERMRLYQQADRIIVQEAPILPLGYGRDQWLVKPWLTMPTSPLGLQILKDAVMRPH